MDDLVSWFGSLAGMALFLVTIYVVHSRAKPDSVLADGRILRLAWIIAIGFMLTYTLSLFVFR